MLTKPFQGNFQEIWGQYQTSDFTYAKPNGQIFPSGKASWDQVAEDYSFFTKYHHEPYFFVCWERQQGDGWEMLGNAWLFANLPNGNGSGIKDGKGREWEIKVPAGFHFVYMKDSSAKHGGINLATTSVTSDTGPVVVELLKRGVMKPSDLGI